jgi:serine/threonine protein kinase
MRSEVGLGSSVGSAPQQTASSESAITLRSDPFEVGEIVAGKYRVERVIGEGAMGIVLAATHLELDEIVAMKFIRPEVQAVPGVVGRFAREAKASARIKGEHTATVLDVGMEPGRGPYIVMEYLEGRDLNEVLRQEGPLPVRRAVEYVLQACEALASAHSNGITHRDIKPENLFLTRQGDMDVLKVLDFGISKAALTGSVFGGDLSLIKTSCFVGTPLYMSPEQIRGTAVDQRTDIWSIGAVLYELLTQRTAFSGASVTQVCALILEGDAEPLRDHCPDAPAELQAIICRCFEKDAKRRFQNVADLATSLLPFAPSRARCHAERASSILRQAGVNVATNVFPSSVPPPSGRVEVSIPWAPRTPTPFSRSLQETCRIERDVPTAPTATATSRRPHARSTRPFWVGGLAFVCAAGLFATRRSDRTSYAGEAPAIATAHVVVLARLRTVLFESDPSDALVEIGGQRVGRTPLRADVETGQRIVQISKEGCEPQTISLEIEPAAQDAEPVRQRIVLRKTAPRTVRAEARGASGAAASRQGLSGRSAKAAAAVPSSTSAADVASVSSDTAGAPTHPTTLTEKRVKLVEDLPRVQLLQ